jgi:hypothetical protein
MTPLFRDRGVPEKVISRLTEELARWNSVKRQQTNRANAQKSQKKEIIAKKGRGSILSTDDCDFAC